MKGPSYFLSEAAEEDLRGIIRYTVKQHSRVQAIKYSAQIERCAEHLANGKQHFRELPDIHPALRYTKCEHHFLFGLFREDRPMIIIAIFHERMDLIQRVANRLK